MISEHEVGSAESGALFSGDRRYRYKLWRRWPWSGPNPKMALFVGLNPSTADENKSDPTVARVIKFAKRWGCGGVYMMNLFAFVTPYPKELVQDDDWEMNLDFLYRCYQDVREQGGPVILAWGAFKEAKTSRRGDAIADLFVGAGCLGKNADGSPKHPLYIKADTKPIFYKTNNIDYHWSNRS